MVMRHEFTQRILRVKLRHEIDVVRIYFLALIGTAHFGLKKRTQDGTSAASGLMPAQKRAMGEFAFNTEARSNAPH
jgi:hypothetical protein